VEGEVLNLQDPILKAISAAAFFGFTFGESAPARRLEEPAGAPPVEIGQEAVALASPATAATLTGATAPKAESNPAPQGSACPSGMLLVDGEHCPEAVQICAKWVDAPPAPQLRCAEFAKPAKCKVATQHRHFCIDREEYAEAPAALPVVRKSWGDAKALCEARGARLCREAEWEFACEGPEMSPYPYGWKRDSSICNFDRTDLGGPEEKLKDHRVPASAFPQCVSPFGVHNMVGNVDEWVERENNPPPYRGVLRGGWWLPGRNRCRAFTMHEEIYSGKQVGFRCCKDAS
jgi:formylglycine-generating enzyme required for sulfatase activity